MARAGVAHVSLLMAAIGLPTGASSLPSAGSSGASSTPPASSSPLALGRLSDIVTAFVVVGSIAAAILSHVHAFGWAPDALIDLFGVAAFGAVLGRASGIGSALAAGATTLSTAQAATLGTLNANTASLVARADLNTAMAEAAHRRLDALGAPPAPLDSTPLTVGHPAEPPS